MKCPHCRHVDDFVIDSRVNADGSAIRRRRKCRNCGSRYSTYERGVDTKVFATQRERAKSIAKELRVMAGRLEGW